MSSAITIISRCLEKFWCLDSRFLSILPWWADDSPVNPRLRSDSPLSRLLRSLGLLCLAWTSPYAIAGPAITEFLADDAEGGEDWIELANETAEAADLGGWQLRDSDETWTFPEDVTLAANGFVVVIASGHSDSAYRDDEGNYHTTFRLNRDGETLSLHDPTGLSVSSPTGPVPPQRSGVSYGVNETGQWQFFVEPTPGMANESEGITGFVDEVATSVEHGFFDTPITVQLATTTPDATIRYTLNGSVPTEESSIYSGPLEIAKTVVLRTQATKEDFEDSLVTTVTYLFPLDVAVQTSEPEGFPERWKSTRSDYEMDSNPTDYAKAAGNADFTAEQARAAIAQSLVAIPSLSIVMSNDDLFDSRNGIYSNPSGRGDRWERPASIELLHPDGTKGFQIDGGIQIMGGTSRTLSFTPKLSFRLVFKREYGPGWLEYPFFGDGGATRFNTLPLRTNVRDSWIAEIGGFGRGLYIGDQWAKQAQLEMGQPATRGNFVHLYLNGVYWGLYNPTERPDAAFAESYLPGVREDYDVVKFCCPDRVVDGSTAMWNRLISLCNRGLRDNDDYFFIQGRDPDGSKNAGFQTLIDLDNFIDYAINGQYHAAGDWPGNYYVLRDGNDDRSDGFKYFTWDNDLAFVNANVNLNKVVTSPGHNWWTESPGVMDIALRKNEEYRLHFADRVYKHYFNGGSLTEEENIKRWNAIAGTIRPALYAESARWGDAKARLRTVQDHWEAMGAKMVETFFPRRQAIVFKQLRQHGLYPDLEPPQMNQSGGVVVSGFGLQFNADAPVYFTTDDSDPRLIGGNPNPAAATVSGGIGEAVYFGEGSALRVMVPGDSSNEANWFHPDFDDRSWTSGETGVGYDIGSGYRDLIGIDLFETMRLNNPSVYLRMPFEVTDRAAVQELRLRMKYDDGFVVYLNGEKIAEANAPAEPAWESMATDGHPDVQAVEFEDFDITASKGLLRDGANILAIQGLNDDKNSSDFLIVPELRATVFEDASRTPITGTTTVKARAFDGNEWSALHEARFIVGVPATAENLRLTEIHYRPAAPSESELEQGYERRSAFEFVELTNSSTTDIILDGLAFTEGIRTLLTGVIPAGASMLVVSNESAFVARYGESLRPNILATFGDGTNLSDSGERIVLADANDKAILELEYSDKAPWPTEADGNGPSIELNGDGSSKASSEPGGSPGTFTAPLARKVRITSVRLVTGADGSPRSLEIGFTGSPGAETPVVELSADLRLWEVVNSTTVANNNAATVNAPLPPPAIGGYVRLRFE